MGPNETETANLKSYLEVADDREKKNEKSHTEKRGKKHHTQQEENRFQDYSQLFSHL